MSVLTILGSARGEGHTRTLLDAAVAGRSHREFDLRELDIGHFEYSGPANRDDFGRVAEAMVAHDRILLATPVYWYAMSGRMKVLFDRFTELITERKDMGRRLGGALSVRVSVRHGSGTTNRVRGAVPGDGQVPRHGLRRRILRPDR